MTKLYLPELCMLVLLCSDAVVASLYCPSPWTEVAGSCFYTTETRVKYGQAKGECTKMGGRIATFTEEEFDQFSASRTFTSDYWIGLECTGDCVLKANWAWNDNTAAGYWTEGNWVWGEPDLGEQNARMTDAKKWAGLYDSFDIGYICKSERKPITTPTSTTSTTTTSPPPGGDKPPLPGGDTPPPLGGVPTVDPEEDPRMVATSEKPESSGNSDWSTHPEAHLGIWIGMACLAVVGVVALALGIVLYNKSRRARVGKEAAVSYRNPDTLPPRTPPPAYEYNTQASAPLDTSMYIPCRNRTQPSVDVFKVHPEATYEQV